MIPWNQFEVYFIKIPFSPISTINFSYDLIKFEDYVKKFLNSLWIRPIFTIIPLNSSEIPKIGKFGIIFDTRLCEIDDLAVSSRQLTEDQFNPIDRLSRQPGGCQAIPCALGDMEYIRTLSWNPSVIGYRVRVILHPHETHE